MSEELPYGKQGQVDFGEYNMRNTFGKRAKVFSSLLYFPVPASNMSGSPTVILLHNWPSKPMKTPLAT